MWATQTERITDTLAWFPATIPMPVADSTEIIKASLRDILHALQHPSPGSALAPLALTETAQLHQLASLFDTPPATANPGGDPQHIPPIVPLAFPPPLDTSPAQAASALRVPTNPASIVNPCPRGPLFSSSEGAQHSPNPRNHLPTLLPTL